MTQILRQSTSIKVRIGPFVDSTDGVTPETGITLGAADQAEILKADGAATSAMAGTFAAVTGADGWYDYTLSTGDTDTVGTLDIVVQDASVCLPVMARFQVVEESVYDALFAASATGIPTAAAIRTEIDSNSTQLAAILTDTGTTLDGKINTISTNVDSILVDTGTTLDAAIAVIDANVDAILVDTGTSGVVIAAAQTVASVTNEVTANVTKISGSATAADNLEASTLGIVATTVNDASATTTSFVITSSEATDDHFNGRVIVFTSGALANQACAITDYVGATKTVTVTALTEAPANGVSMVIV